MGNKPSRVAPKELRSTGMMTTSVKRKEVGVETILMEEIDDEQFAAFGFSTLGKDHYTLTWKVQNFKEMVMIASSRQKELVAKFDFFMPFTQEGCEDKGKGRCGAYLAWLLTAHNKSEIEVLPEYSNWETIPMTVIRLELEQEDLTVERDRGVCCAYCKELVKELFCHIKAQVFVDGNRIGLMQSEAIRNLSQGNWGWDMFAIFKEDEKLAYLQADGSLLLVLTTTAYFPLEEKTNVVAERLSTVRKFKEESQKVKESCRARLLTDVRSLLGDKQSSDVVISIVDPNASTTTSENEVGKFFSHKAILSARSSVFRRMFQDEFSKQTETRITFSNVRYEVMEQFLTFLYTGGLKGDLESQGDNSAWACNIIKDLLEIAEKFDVKQLKEYCDAHIYRVLTDENVGDIYKLAKRHGLRSAGDIVDTQYNAKMDVLLESLCKQ